MAKETEEYESTQEISKTAKSSVLICDCIIRSHRRRMTCANFYNLTKFVTTIMRLHSVRVSAVNLNYLTYTFLNILCI